MRVNSLSRVLLFCCISSALLSAQSSFKRPIQTEQMPRLLRPGFHHPAIAPLTLQEREQLRAAAQSGTLETLPYWQGSFTIVDTSFNYTILGNDPQTGGTVTIPTPIIPLRITVSDYSVDGQNPIVFDATPAVPQVAGSPIFQVSDYITGYQQFGDAMLHAEFPDAAHGWHTLLQAIPYPALDITIEPGGAQVFQTKSGQLFANILDDSDIDNAILTMLRSGAIPPQMYPIFISYNSSEHDAFGYHAAIFRKGGSEENVFAYSSWLIGLDDLFSIPSPDAATLSHEVAETIHDAFNGDLASLTVLWGDPFGHNRCFQNFIEVGDAVEDAPGNVQLHQQVVGLGNKARIYTLQNEATLPWFERKTPSDALAATYSFPDIWVLPAAAPYRCEQ